MAKNKHIQEEKLAGELIKTAGAEKAPDNFTEAFMERLHKETSLSVINYKPLIPKGFWYFIAVTMALLAVIILLVPAEDTGTGYGEKFVNDYLSPYAGSFVDLITAFSGSSFLLIATAGMAGIWLLYFIDKFMQKKTDL